MNTQPVYGKKIFLWEIQSIEEVMAHGVQRAISCDFVIKGPNVAPTPTETCSKWKLTLDLEDVEPAVTVHKVSPEDKTIYFRLSLQAMKSSTEETDVISKQFNMIK